MKKIKDKKLMENISGASIDKYQSGMECAGLSRVLLIRLWENWEGEKFV